MGLLDYLNQGLDTIKSQPKMYDPHANARALMGGQPMQQQPIDMYPTQPPQTIAHENQHITQDIPAGPTLHEPTQFSTIEQEQPRAMPQVPEGNYPNQRPMFNQNPGGMEGQGGYDPVAEMMKRKQMAQNPILNSNTYQEPVSPYDFNGFPNQVGNPNESNLTQVNKDPFSWLRGILSPETLSPEELRKRGF